MKVVEYKFETVQSIIDLLNAMTVTGVKNCEIIFKIATLLETGEVNLVANRKKMQEKMTVKEGDEQ